MAETEAIDRKVQRSIDVRRKRDETYDERRAKAFMEGRKFERLVCPLCQWSHPMSTHRKGDKRFRVEDDPEVVQVRYAIFGRTTGGFFKKDEESITLSGLATRLDIYENLKSEVTKLYNLLYGGVKE